MCLQCLLLLFFFTLNFKREKKEINVRIFNMFTCAQSNELRKNFSGVRFRIRFASARRLPNDCEYFIGKCRLMMMMTANAAAAAMGTLYAYMFDINELYLNLGFWLAARTFTLCVSFEYWRDLASVLGIHVLCIFGFIESHTSLCVAYLFIRLDIRAKCTNRLRFDSIWFDFALCANGEERSVWFIQTAWVVRNAHPNTLNSHENRYTHTLTWMASHFYCITCESTARQAHLRLRIYNLNIDCSPDHKINNNKRAKESERN